MVAEIELRVSPQAIKPNALARVAIAHPHWHQPDVGRIVRRGIKPGCHQLAGCAHRYRANRVIAAILAGQNNL